MEEQRLEFSFLRPCVVHVVAAGGMYGLERMVLALLPALRTRGVDARLLILNGPADPNAELGVRLAAEGVPVAFAATGPRLGPGDLANVWSTLARWQPAIVHTHGYKATILAGAVGLMQRRRTMKTQHAEALYYAKLAKRLRIEGLVARRFDRVVAVSEGVRREQLARGFREDRIRVIPNGISPPVIGNQSRAKGSTTARLLYLGRLVEGKDVHLLIDAVRRLDAEGLSVELLIAGDGPTRSELEAQAASGRLRAGTIRFLGFVSEPEKVLAEADVLVLPSQHEGLPISVLEAMACGIAIVASNVGGIGLAIRHQREGLLVPAGRQEPLEAAIRRLVLDPTLRAKLGTRARKRFQESWTAGIMADEYAALYAELITGRTELRTGAAVTG